MAKKTKISEEDLIAFHKAVEGTKPLVQKKIRISHRPSIPRLMKPTISDKEALHFTEKQDLNSVHGEEFIVHKQAGISNKTLRKLRKGQYNVEATLDLHGMSVEVARTAVDDFLQYSLQEGIRVVLIIHGKGHHSQTPILKNKLNHWLRETNVVLAFCSAAPSHGSRGAIYVLLKRTTQEDVT